MLSKNDIQKLLNNIGLGLEELEVKSDGLFKVVNLSFNGQDSAPSINTLDGIIEYLQYADIIKCYRSDNAKSKTKYTMGDHCESIKNPYYHMTIEELQIKADLL